MKLSIKSIFFFVLACVQVPIVSKGQSSLEQVRIEIALEQEKRDKRISEHLLQSGQQRSYIDSRGNLVVLSDVVNGVPIFETVDNSEAGVTIGVSALRGDGVLGLDIQGENTWFGVWDGGIVKEHVEFGTRVISTQGANYDNHATHVTGTIMAAGVNPLAKGMAPKAKAYTFDFFNDEQEMLTLVKADASSMLLSNHSYGVVCGWRFDNGWQWFGDRAVSSIEDYKFGFYSQGAREWDEIAFNAPYYLICKSAGNDRSDSGSTGNPPDCNGGSGYDCIGDAATAKNILTVGAVDAVLDYIGPGSVKMSTFSSWGPTDDGRIKPDLVANGVNVLSSIATGTNQYGFLSGTSMATPNATGGLVLLQDFYKQLHQVPMKSATLKALAIHTVKEAGVADGPDARFGWGLLDVGAAAKLIKEEDGLSNRIEELVIQEGETISLSLLPIEGSKVVVTIAWTDPAASPLAPSLDPLTPMLVNDLDIQIASGAGELYLPWKLDPNDFDRATKGVNSLDNVEKIEFSAQSSLPHTLLISHKKTLRNGRQPFSLVVTYIDAQPRKKLFWVGNSGSWSNGQHWSLTPGGAPSGDVPTLSDDVYFDGLSFTQDNSSVIVEGEVKCRSVKWLTAKPALLSFSTGVLEVSNGVVLSAANLQISGNGSIVFNSSLEEVHDIILDKSNLSTLGLIFKNGFWRLKGNAIIRSLEVTGGTLDATDSKLVVDTLDLTSNSEKHVIFNNTVLEDVVRTDVGGENLKMDCNNCEIITKENADVVLHLGNVEFDGLINVRKGTASVTSTGLIEELILDGSIVFNSSMRINRIEAYPKSNISLNDAVRLTLSEYTFLKSSTLSELITISSPGTAELNFPGYYKLCFDFLKIEGIDVSGDAIVSAGVNSNVVSGENWIEDECGDVLFPKFKVLYNCVNGLTEFVDESEGEISSWSWSFGDTPNEFSVNSISEGKHLFKKTGDFDVTLTISNKNDQQALTQRISILENTLSPNEIVFSNSRLFSVQSANSYQWYRNGIVIPGKTERGIDFPSQAANLVVVIKDDKCSRLSAPFIVTNVENNSKSSLYSIYPNPLSSDGLLHILCSASNSEFELYDFVGRKVLSEKLDLGESILNLSHLQPGSYHIVLKSRNSFKNETLIIQGLR